MWYLTSRWMNQHMYQSLYSVGISIKIEVFFLSTCLKDFFGSHTQRDTHLRDFVLVVALLVSNEKRGKKRILLDRCYAAA